jgi:hypothetical protein
MEGKEARVYWQTKIVLGKEGEIVHGRAHRVSKESAVISLDRNLTPGERCKLALMLPKESLDCEPLHVIGNAEVVMSVLSSMQFQITVRWLDMDESSKNKLSEQILKIAGK